MLPGRCEYFSTLDLSFNRVNLATHSNNVLSLYLCRSAIIVGKSQDSACSNEATIEHLLQKRGSFLKVRERFVHRRLHDL